MPRKWTIKVKPYPPYVPGRYYTLRVTSVSKGPESGAVAVELEHVETDQQGRHVSVLLPPPHPDGLTANFFAACGQNVEIDRTLLPEDCQGKILTACFAPDSHGSWHISDFAPVKEVTS